MPNRVFTFRCKKLPTKKLQFRKLIEVDNMQKSVFVYHEKQGLLNFSLNDVTLIIEGALCGLHCLNTLLQAPHFTEIGN
jgi:hypothetical protein